MGRHWYPCVIAPRDGTEILAYSASGKMAVVYYKPELKVWMVSGTERLIFGQVTHWQPLPSTLDKETRELQSGVLKNKGRMPTMEEFVAYGPYLQSLLTNSGQRVTMAISGSELEDNVTKGSDGSPYWLWVPEQQIWIQIERYQVERIVDLHHVDFTFSFDK